MPMFSGSAVPSSATEPEGETIRADVLIVGSGMGGGTLFWALRDQMIDVLLIERGRFLPHEPENGDANAVFRQGRYRTEEPWWDVQRQEWFPPGVYSWVGGSTKMYAASAPRLRVRDFKASETRDGVSPAWPFKYGDIEPYYCMAEELYEVHGTATEDPTEPPRSKPYPFPPLEHEPEVDRFAGHLRRAGLHPFHMASTMQLPNGALRHIESTAAGGPSPTGAKSDAENHAIVPALNSETNRLLTEAEVTRLVIDGPGEKILYAEARYRDRTIRIEASQFIVACGAVSSAALLLRSRSDRQPGGLANSSGMVGRNYMAHNASVIMAIHPWRRNGTGWQKTLGMDDWYLEGPDGGFPLGNLQMMGKIQAPMLKSARPWVPTFVLRQLAHRSLDVHVSSEDLPDPNNQVALKDSSIALDWTPRNVAAHLEMVARVRRLLHGAGYPVVLIERMGISYNSHQMGTVVAGEDSRTSVLDRDCRSHDVENLWVVDGSFFPSAGALNPALTIAANALRVAPKIAAAASARRL